MPKKAGSYMPESDSTAEIRDRLAQEREAAAAQWAENRTREAVEQWTRERDELVATITTFPGRVRHERENFDNERATALHESEYNAKLTELTSHQYLLERTFNHVDRKASDLSGHADFGAAQIVREAQSVLLHEAAFPGSIPDAELGRATLTIHDKSAESVALREQAAQQEITIRQLHPEFAIKTDPQIQHTIAQYASPLEVTAPELTQPAVRDATAAIERGNDGILRQDGTQIAREIENTGERMKVALRTDLQPESLRAMAEYALSQGYTNVTIRASEAHQDSLQARWREYTVVGMNVRGYEPTPEDLQYVKEQRELVAQGRAGQAVEQSGSEVGQAQTPMADAQSPALTPANQTQKPAEPAVQTPSALAETSAPAVASQAPQQAEQPVQAPSSSVAVEVSSPADATQPQQPAEKTVQTPSAPAGGSTPALASQAPQQQAQQLVEAPSVAVDAARPAVTAQAPQQEADRRHDMAAAARPGAGITRDNPERVNVTRHTGSIPMSDRMVAQAPAERGGGNTEPRMSDRMIAQRGDAPQVQQPEMSQRMANIVREDAARPRNAPGIDVGGVPR